MNATDARDLSSRLADLLRREHVAMADFLVALADFDRRRCWEELGHGSLFDYLHRELGLSRGTAFYRKTTADLIQRFPEVVEPLRDGRLCITSVIELAKVITAENRAEVLPRFFHRSRQEAKAVSAELSPVLTPPRRTVVTAPPAPPALDLAQAVQPVELRHPEVTGKTAPAASAPALALAPALPAHDEAVPLTADLRRLHVTVSATFLRKLDAARSALSHKLPGATIERILEAGLDLVLERDAKRKGFAAKPRPPQPTAHGGANSGAHVPAHVRREVWTRD